MEKFANQKPGIDTIYLGVSAPFLSLANPTKARNNNNKSNDHFLRQLESRIYSIISFFYIKMLVRQSAQVSSLEPLVRVSKRRQAGRHSKKFIRNGKMSGETAIFTTASFCPAAFTPSSYTFAAANFPSAKSTYITI